MRIRTLPLANLSLLLALTGLSCGLPERPFTFLPPTNIKQLCQSDRRFFYSSDFDFCFQYPSSGIWSEVEVSSIKALSGTNISSYDFYLPHKNQPVLMFTVYVTSSSSQQAFADQGIAIVREQEPYAIGVIKHEGIPAELRAAGEEIDTALQSIQVFAKPITIE